MASNAQLIEDLRTRADLCDRATSARGYRDRHERGLCRKPSQIDRSRPLEECNEIVDLCLDLGTDHINISALHTSGTAFRNFWEVTPRYDEIQPYVLAAVDRAVARDSVITLEGFPYCSIPGYERYMLDWDENRFKMLYRKFVFEDYEKYMDTYARVKDKRCRSCLHNDKCGGVYKEYADLVGWDEFQPVTPVENK